MTPDPAELEDDNYVSPRELSASTQVQCFSSLLTLLTLILLYDMWLHSPMRYGYMELFEVEYLLRNLLELMAVMAGLACAFAPRLLIRRWMLAAVTLEFVNLIWQRATLNPYFLEEWNPFPGFLTVQLSIFTMGFTLFLWSRKLRLIRHHQESADLIPEAPASSSASRCLPQFSLWQLSLVVLICSLLFAIAPAASQFIGSTFMLRLASELSNAALSGMFYALFALPIYLCMLSVLFPQLTKHWMYWFILFTWVSVCTPFFVDFLADEWNIDSLPDRSHFRIVESLLLALLRPNAIALIILIALRLYGYQLVRCSQLPVPLAPADTNTNAA